MAFNRRRFLLGSAAVAAGAGLAGAPVAWARTRTAAPVALPTGPGTVRSRNGLLRTTLTAGTGPATAGGIRWSSGLMTYNGRFAGPTMIVRPGDTLELLLRNRLTKATNMHWHGFHVSPKGDQDNVFLNIAPGRDYQYRLQLPTDLSPGMYWYHPHLHGNVGEQIYGGLRGVILVEGGIADDPRVRPLRRRILNLNYLSMDRSGSVPVLVPYDQAGADNAVHMVNAEIEPTLGMRPGETQFWQIANTATDAYYRLEIPQASMQVVEQDGAPVWRSWFTDSIVMPPGMRLGILVTAPRTPGRTSLRSAGYVQGVYGEWPAVTLADIHIAGDEAVPVRLPEELAEPPAFLSAPVARRRILTMNETPADQAPVFWFNREPFEQITMADVFQVQVGTVEEWVIRNATTTARGRMQESHPYHQHVNDFVIVERGTWDSVTGQVTSRERVAPRCTMDTANVDPNGYIRIRTHFKQFTGRTVYHCHILFHEDNGMMGIFDILNADGSGVGADQLLPSQHMHG